MDQEQRHIHKFTDTVVPPTCQERGYTLHSCDCGYSHKNQFTPLGSHQYEIAEAKEVYQDVKSYAEVGRALNIHPGTVSRIIRGIGKYDKEDKNG